MKSKLIVNPQRDLSKAMSNKDDCPDDELNHTNNEDEEEDDENDDTYSGSSSEDEAPKSTKAQSRIGNSSKNKALRSQPVSKQYRKKQSLQNKIRVEEIPSDDADCGGFDIIFTPIQYLHTLLSTQCDNEEACAAVSDGSVTSSDRSQSDESSDENERARNRPRSDHFSNASDTSNKGPKKVTWSNDRNTSSRTGGFHSKESMKSAIKTSPRLHNVHPTVNEDIDAESNASRKVVPLKNKSEVATNHHPLVRAISESEATFNIESFMEEMSCIGVILTWHKQQVGTTTKNKLPTTVRTFLEISDTTVSRSSMWGPFLLLEQLDTSGGEHLKPLQRRKINLFDITIISRAAASSLQHFPLACPGHCFLVTLSDGETLVLEAPNEADARKIVLGLRWTIAKLSFNILIGNTDTIEELLPIRRIQHSLQPVIVDSAELDAIMKSVTLQLIESVSV